MRWAGPAWLLLGVGVAHANVAAPTRAPAVQGAPGPIASTPLAVASARVDIDCGPARAEVACDVVATYVIHNPTADAVALTAAFAGVRTEVTAATLDGRDARVALDDAAAADFDALPDDVAPWAGERTLQGVAVRLDGGARATLVVRGVMRPWRTVHHEYAWRPAEVRHPALAVGRGDRIFELTYLLHPITSWAAWPTVEVRLRHGPGWVLNGTPGPGEVVEHVDPAARRTVGLWLRDPGPALLPGGPALGLGVDLDGGPRWRGRLAYEAHGPAWVVYGLQADVVGEDAVDAVEAALVAELASPGIFGVIPTLGLGAGPAVRVWPEAALGVRAQLTVHWPWAGLVANWDAQPALGELGRFGFMVQVGI
ncbi:MAG: hypothetical protein H6704_05840 [Myxococcales bacterium]|nr:hypothetical protein [Myxococcales bacterium]